METIEGRANNYVPDVNDHNYIELRSRGGGKFISQLRSANIVGAKEQKSLDDEKACNIFCYTGCPHKTDSYNCLNKCDTWKIFRRMLKE